MKALTRREFFKRTAPLVAAGAVTPSLLALVMGRVPPPKKCRDVVRGPGFTLETENRGEWKEAVDCHLGPIVTVDMTAPPPPPEVWEFWIAPVRPVEFIKIDFQQEGVKNGAG
jgi:hypothetical protein